jgi:hypothetical protein
MAAPLLPETLNIWTNIVAHPHAAAKLIHLTQSVSIRCSIGIAGVDPDIGPWEGLLLCCRAFAELLQKKNLFLQKERIAFLKHLSGYWNHVEESVF